MLVASMALASACILALSIVEIAPQGRGTVSRYRGAIDQVHDQVTDPREPSLRAAHQPPDTL
jgi:hypothetical protein